LFMQEINTCMKTYTALVKAHVNNSIRAVPVEIRALTAVDAKWLLQAVYGFNALVGGPNEVHEDVQTTEDISKPLTPDQQKIKSLQTTKDNAANALKTERNRQKKARATAMLRSVNAIQAKPSI